MIQFSVWLRVNHSWIVLIALSKSVCLLLLNASSANMLQVSPIRHGVIDVTPALPAGKQSAGHAWAAELIELQLH